MDDVASSPSRTRAHPEPLLLQPGRLEIREGHGAPDRPRLLAEVERLLEAGVGVDVATDFGETALELASRGFHTAVAPPGSRHPALRRRSGGTRRVRLRVFVVALHVSYTVY